jgi:hypothetical protein
MSRRDLQTLLSQGIGPMFQVEPRGELTRVRTPFSYPDGGVVDLFVKQNDGSFTLTDLGESLGWLRMQSRSMQRSAKQQHLVQDVCLTQGVELFKGQLTLRVSERAELPRAIVRLGQAVVRVADLAFCVASPSFAAR